MREAEGASETSRIIIYTSVFLSPYHVFTIYLNFFLGVQLFMHTKSLFVCFKFRLGLQWQTVIIMYLVARNVSFGSYIKELLIMLLKYMYLYFFCYKLRNSHNNLSGRQ